MAAREKKNDHCRAALEKIVWKAILRGFSSVFRHFRAARATLSFLRAARCSARAREKSVHSAREAAAISAGCRGRRPAGPTPFPDRRIFNFEKCAATEPGKPGYTAGILRFFFRSDKFRLEGA